MSSIDEDDMESVASDISELRYASMEDVCLTEKEQKNKKLSEESLATFLEESFNSKKLIEQASAYCPDLRLLVRSLNTYRKTADFPSREKVRIQRMAARISKHVKDSLKPGAKFDDLSTTSREGIINKKRGIPSKSDFASVD